MDFTKDLRPEPLCPMRASIRHNSELGFLTDRREQLRRDVLRVAADRDATSELLPFQTN